MSLPPSPCEVLSTLADIARRLGAVGQPHLLSDRADAIVGRVGDVVVKAHPLDTDADALRIRLHLAAHPPLRRILLTPIPIDGDIVTDHAGRLFSAWPYGDPVNPEDPDAAPWEEAATLLALLHRLRPPPTVGSTAAGGPDRVRRGMDRLRAASAVANPAAAEVIRRAYGGLPALDDTAVRRTLVHGDFHLGQLARIAVADGNPWRLLDIDDLGIGDPVWDLARPAAFFAAGILDPVAWERFLTAYRQAGGPAVPADGEVWSALDIPARALVVQAAAIAVAKAGIAGRDLDESETALVDSCRRMPPAVW